LARESEKAEYLPVSEQGIPIDPVMAGVYACAMTDKELRDAAVAELKLTTAGWLKTNGAPRYPSGVAPATTHWGKAMTLLAQIGQAPSSTVFPSSTRYPSEVM
jgi:hypothetical protein